MTWHPTLSERRRLILVRIGLLRGELRLFLRSDEDTVSKFVIQMKEVACFYDSLQRGAEIRISDFPEHGSFGWWLPPDDPHHSLKVAGVGEGSGFFLALAKQVEYRFAGGGEAINWPG